MVGEWRAGDLDSSLKRKESVTGNPEWETEINQIASSRVTPDVESEEQIIRKLQINTSVEMSESVFGDNLSDAVVGISKLSSNVSISKGSEGIKWVQGQFEKSGIGNIFSWTILGKGQSVIMDSDEVGQVQQVSTEGTHKTLASETIEGSNI
mgnify:CR=1 FL=1